MYRLVITLVQSLTLNMVLVLVAFASHHINEYIKEIKSK